jgi:hypothetical protein
MEGPTPEQSTRDATGLLARVIHVSDEFVQLGFENVEFFLLSSQLLLGLDFGRLTLLLKVRRGFEVGFGALECLIDLRLVLSGIWGVFLKMLDLGRFTLQNDLHFSQLRASVI